MEEIVSMERWASWNEEIKERLRRSARDFVAIGFRLRQIKDSGIYDGAADLYEFAQREYGLNKSAVSRFMAINEKYSEGGYGLTIASEYENYKYSQLTEMLTLPDNQHQYITESTTVREIRQIKEFNKDEEQAKDEAENGVQTSLFEKPKSLEVVEELEMDEVEAIIFDYFKDKQDEWDKCKAGLEVPFPDNFIKQTVCPAGSRTHRFKATLMMMSDSRGITIRTIGKEPVTMGWNEWISVFRGLFPGDTYLSYYPQKVVENETKEVLVKEVETKEEDGGIVATGILTEEGKELIDGFEEKDIAEEPNPTETDDEEEREPADSTEEESSAEENTSKVVATSQKKEKCPCEVFDRVTWMIRDGDGNNLVGFERMHRQIVVKQGNGAIGKEISYCPWCGKKLKEDK